MIIHNFDVVSVPIKPGKANAPLPVDPDAVLTFSLAGQLFQSIGWWRAQIIDALGCMKIGQAAQGMALNLMR